MHRGQASPPWPELAWQQIDRCVLQDVNLALHMDKLAAGTKE
jgi:hypothetical protein